MYRFHYFKYIFTRRFMSNKETVYYDTFEMSPINYNEILLKESNEKHAVPMNIPPQLPPPGVALPVYSKALNDFLSDPTIELRYAPTYEPPPIETMGKRASEIFKIHKIEKKLLPVDSNVAVEKRFTQDELLENRSIGEWGDKELKDLILVWDRWGPLAWAELHPGNQDSSNQFKPSYNTPTFTTSAELIVNTQKQMISFAKLKKATARSFTYTDSMIKEIVNIWDKYGHMTWAEFTVEETNNEKYKYSESFRTVETSAKVSIDRDKALSSVKAKTEIKGNNLQLNFPNPFGDETLTGDQTLVDRNLFQSPFVTKLSSSQQVEWRLTKANSSYILCHICKKECGTIVSLTKHYQCTHLINPPTELIQIAKKHKRLQFIDKPIPERELLTMRGKVKPRVDKDSSHPSKIASEVSTTHNQRLSNVSQLSQVVAHYRLPVNIHLSGQIKNLEIGYLGTQTILQIIMEVVEDLPSLGPQDQKIVVRCIGEEFSKLIKNIINIGDNICISGLLKLNRTNILKSQPACEPIYKSFPYVQISPPHGSLITI